MRLVATGELPAPPERAWAVATDWERQADWMPDVAWVRVLGPDRALGAQMEIRTKVLGVPLATDVLTVTAWEPPRRLEVDHRGVVAGWGAWLFEPAGETRTRFTWEEVIHLPPPVLGDAAIHLYGPIQRWMLRRSVRNLRRLLAGSG